MTELPTAAPTLPPSTLASIATMLASKGLAAAGAVLVTHGLMTSNGTEALIALAPILVSVGWSLWNEYLKVIVRAQLEVLKAKSLAQAAALKQASLPKVTVAQIAAQSPTMGPPDVVKAIATLPPEIKATVALPLAPVIIAALAGTLFLGLLCPGTAYAQVPQRRPFIPTGNLPADIAATKPGAAAVPNAIETFLAKPFKDLADFIGADSDAAIALSTAIPELQDGHGQQCWLATRQFGEVVKAHPIPLTLKAQTDLEALRLLMMAANNLCSNVHCTQVFGDLATGVQTLAPINYSIPIPSLHDLCAKVPQIAVIAPVSVPVTAPAAPPAQ